MSTRITLVNQETGEKDWYLGNQGRVVDLCKLVVLAKHNVLYANQTVSGDPSSVTNAEELAARVFVYGIPKDHNKSRYEYPLLINKPLNLPASADVGKSIGTVLEFSIVPDIIGIEIQIEPRPVQIGLVDASPDTVLDVNYSTGCKTTLTAPGDTDITHYYLPTQVTQKNYLNGILNYSLIFRSSRVIDEGVNNTGA